MATTALVAMENASLQYDRLYSYLIPAEMPLLPGCRVTVPFGTGNRTRLGMVFGIAEQTPDAKLKAVQSLVDATPLLSDELLELAGWLREQTFCGYYDAVRTLLPPGIGVRLHYLYLLEKNAVLPPEADDKMRQIYEYLAGKGKPAREETLLAALELLPDAPALLALCRSGAVIKSQETRRRVLDEKLVMARLADGIEELADVKARISVKQKTVVELLLEVGQASVKELCYFTGVGPSVCDRLEKAGVLCYFTKEVYRSPYDSPTKAADLPPEILLSEEQETAFERLCRLADSGKAACALLYGVTGSGKTEVFLRTIRHVLDGGRGVIVMVPEISLTPQTIARFQRYFGGAVAVLHSGLSMGERLDEWKRIKNGDAQIVIGTRSAVFAPLRRIGLILLDEEQEGTYKSEKSPRYHARDVARMRVTQQNALLLLASATPSIESFFRAKQQKYHLLTLKKRYGAAKLPDVQILDLSTEPLEGESNTLSQGLLYELRLNLERGEQSILLLNRRGYNTLVKCAVCGKVASCPNCSVSLTFHNVNGQLMCHYCGHNVRADAVCPECGSKFRRFSGAGTQKVEEELRAIFPQARVLRMDMDTTMARFSHEQYFGDILAGKYDIIIGTQMVAKGLDFPNVTLVGVLSADSALYAQDYRSFERAFSLFTQVVGRSGRAEKAGRAFIQTFTPENPVIEMAARQDYDSFYSEEIENRQVHLYPPFCDMAGIGFSGVSRQEVEAASERFLQKLTAVARERFADLPLRVLGPCESQIPRLAGKFRRRMAIKCVWGARTRALLWETAAWFWAQPTHRGISMYIDPKYENSI